MKHIQTVFFGLAILFLVSSTPAFAQLQNAPGLYGRRLIVEVGMGMMQNWSGNRYNHNDKDRPIIAPISGETIFPLHYAANVQLQTSYAISRVSMVGLNITHARLGFGHDEYDESINPNVHTNNFNFFYRRYLINRGAIAPLGFYYQGGPTFVLSKRFFRESKDFYDDPENFGIQYFPTFGGHIELGRQSIINEKILFCFAVQAGIISNINPDEHFKANGYSIIDTENMHSRVVGHNIMKFKVSFGFPVKTPFKTPE